MSSADFPIYEAYGIPDDKVEIADVDGLSRFVKPQGEADREARPAAGDNFLVRTPHMLKMMGEDVDEDEQGTKN